MRFVTWHGRPVRQGQQGADGIHAEAKIPAMLDEGEPLEMSLAVAPLIALRTLRFWQESSLLVIADRFDFHARAFRQRADRHDAGEWRVLR